MEPRSHLSGLPLRLRLVECLAGFARLLSIYPPTNRRVAASLDALMDVFGAVQASGKPRPVRVVFGVEHVRVDGEEYELRAAGPAAWMRERLDRTGLVGLELDAGLRPGSVTAFCRLLLDNQTTASQVHDCEELWRRAPADVRPIERRFDGDFSGGLNRLGLGIDHETEIEAAGGTSYLAGVLATEASVQERFEALQAALEREQGGPTAAIDLLDHIARLLPADTMTDLEHVVALTNQILEETLRGIERARTRHEEGPDLERMLAAVARNLFTRPDAELTEDDLTSEPADVDRPPASAVRETGKRRGDDDVSDDQEQMLIEFDRLPNFDPNVALFRAEDSFAEQVGVFLHYHLQDEQPLRQEVLERHILALLASGVPSVLGVLGEYVDLLRCPQGRQSIHTGRLLHVLRVAGLSGTLRSRGVVSAAGAVASFPADFGPYLDALDLEHPCDLDELVGVCRELGEERIVAAGPRLVQDEQLLRHGRIEDVLARAQEAFSPLALVALQHGDDALRERIVAYLRSLDLERKEACLLTIGDGLEYFPHEYLAALLDHRRAGDRRRQEKLHRWVSMMLRRYVRNDLNEEARRVYAIRFLADFWEDEATELLTELARQPLLGRSAVPPAIRRAARETLTAMGAA